MKRHLLFAAIVLPLFFQTTFGQQPASPTAPAAQATPAARGQRRGGATPPPIQAKPEELAKIKEKTAQIEGLVKELKAKRRPGTGGRCRGLCARRQDAPRIPRDVRQASRHRTCLRHPRSRHRARQTASGESAAMESGQKADPCLHLRNRRRGSPLRRDAAGKLRSQPSRPVSTSGCTAVRTTRPRPSSFTAS